MPFFLSHDHYVNSRRQILLTIGYNSFSIHEPWSKHSGFWSGVGDVFTIAGRMNCALSLLGRKIN